eukprot:CAMPEP_0184718434 /NCGR_PEP_ID=MMETSP0314-20130426/7631_1 /TAXON_ID=38298 /ORGANISM="Rhodella maculata, Strain CCMP 736" /LENGTH=56 /DNA_ID=CAMNT_0027182177 /DNA_START=801 /DNA_END=968 /DNA_ORIENTATION=-
MSPRSPRMFLAIEHRRRPESPHQSASDAHRTTPRQLPSATHHPLRPSSAHAHAHAH